MGWNGGLFSSGKREVRRQEGGKLWNEITRGDEDEKNDLVL